MATAITTAFEHWNAQQVLNGLAARPDTVIFANVPGLDPNADIDRGAGLPAAEHIVYRHLVDQAGIVNENAVAYSVVLDTTVGDFEFNWMGLLHESSNTLCMVVHTLPQQKIATNGGFQGNNITRTFLMSFAGAAESSKVNVTAETWQIDFTARLTGIDESIRLSNLDYYGAAAFVGGGFKVAIHGGNYHIAPGVGYVGGLRVVLDNELIIPVNPDFSKIYLDVTHQGTITGRWQSVFAIRQLNELSDYIDAIGNKHYTVELAVNNQNQAGDVRPEPPMLTELMYLVGMPIPWPSDVLPDSSKFAFMHGQQFDLNAYPRLAKIYHTGWLPDMRGLVIKGAGNGRTKLTREEDDNKWHTHGGYTHDADLGSRLTTSFDYGIKETSTNGNHNHAYQTGGTVGGGLPSLINGHGGYKYTEPGGDHVHSVNIGAHAHWVEIGAHSHGLTIGHIGSSEVTVKNLAFNYIVRLA